MVSIALRWAFDQSSSLTPYRGAYPSRQSGLRLLPHSGVLQVLASQGSSRNWSTTTTTTITTIITTTTLFVAHEKPTELIMSVHGAHQSHSQHGLPIRTAHVVIGLFALRLINTACTDQTFFQPDEYFQALEPAWNLVFGPNSGAWLTWVGYLSSADTLIVGWRELGADQGK